MIIMILAIIIECQQANRMSYHGSWLIISNNNNDNDKQ